MPSSVEKWTFRSLTDRKGCWSVLVTGTLLRGVMPG
jgi:hypothetical protein